jgi:protein-tyrosine phosphatase
LLLCRRLVDDGVSDVIATPHQLGTFSGRNKAVEIREAVAALNEQLKKSNIGLTVMPGGDIRVEESIRQLLEADEILTLADGGKYILLELPHEVFIDIGSLLLELASLGVRAIISHPERHCFLAKQPKILLKWLDCSACLQITAGSLLGEFGYAVQKAAWYLLSSGLVSLVATDSHNLDGRKPCMRAAFGRISIKLGQATASLVCIENPTRVLSGQDILPVQCGILNEVRQ